MVSKKDKPRTLGELLPMLEDRSSTGAAAWRAHIEKHALPGETWGQADARLRRELDAAIANPSEEQGKKAATASNVVRLPFWVDEVRAVPNGVLRSALFGAIRKGRRPALEGALMATVDGVKIKYTGFRLDQNDLTVWETILHAVREQKLGGKCYVSLYSLLKMMGKTISGASRKSLQSSIVRLKANAIEINQGRYSYFGSLIDEAYKDEETKEWVIVINQRLRNLYSPDGFTQIDWKVRQSLEGQQLAQWLHGFYSSHAEPYPIKIETLRELSGSEAGELKHFTEKLKKALKALKEASQTQGQCFSYEIRDGKVFVEHIGTAAQQKHLARKARQEKPKKLR